MSAIAKHTYGIVAFLMLAGFCSPAPAHKAFRNQLQQKYPGKKVNCNACHVKGKPKTERNEFGKLFAKELKASHPTLTEEWKSKKGADRKKYETTTMVPAFDMALGKVKTFTNDKQEIYDDLIKTGKVPEIENDPKYKPDRKSTTESGGDQATTETKDTSDKNGRSDLSKEKPASDSESKSKKG